ncbi:MAG: hypothetical protein OHK0039_33810 [Bacteroidia bacterium]
MLGYILVPLFIALAAAYLYVRYLLLRLGLKDSKSGGVQHTPRAIPPKPRSDEPFLPGSRMGLPDENSSELIHHIMSEGLAIYRQQYIKPRYTRRLFTSKQDIRRSYFIDALIDKPHWKAWERGELWD